MCIGYNTWKYTSILVFTSIFLLLLVKLSPAQDPQFVDDRQSTTDFMLGAEFNGTDGPDDLGGSDLNDTLIGMDGPDTLFGNDGDDIINGGSGSDALDGSNGNDFLIGGAGSDILNGGDGDDIIIPGSGNDIVDGGTGGNDFVILQGSRSEYNVLDSAQPGYMEITDTVSGRDNTVYVKNAYVVFSDDEAGNNTYAQGASDLELVLVDVQPPTLPDEVVDQLENANSSQDPNSQDPNNVAGGGGGNNADNGQSPNDGNTPTQPDDNTDNNEAGTEESGDQEVADAPSNVRGIVGPQPENTSISQNDLNQTAVVGSGGVSALLDADERDSSRIIDMGIDSTTTGQYGFSGFAYTTYGKTSRRNKTIDTKSATNNPQSSFASPTSLFSSIENFENYDEENSFKLQQGTTAVVGKSNEEESESFSATTGIRYQMSNPTSNGKHDKTVIGAFVNYTHTDVEIGSNDALFANNVDQAGDVTLEKWGFGAFGVATFSKNYIFGLASASFGEVDTNNKILSSKGSYDVTGFTLHGGVGRIVSLGSESDKVDLRAFLTYSYGEGDAYTDTANIDYGESEGDQLISGVSAKFFSSHQHKSWLFRPFFQIGANYIIFDEVDLDINDVNYEISDNDKVTAVGRVGLDFSVKNFQGYLAAEGEIGDDIENYGLGAGITLKLN